MRLYSSKEEGADRSVAMSGRGGGRGRGRGGGRGEYYKNKYGGGGRGRGRGGGGGRGRGGRSSQSSSGGGVGGSYETDLLSLLQRLDGQSYGAYHELDTAFVDNGGWRGSSFTLYVERAQSDPFAAPTRCRLVIPNPGYPKDLFESSIESSTDVFDGCKIRRVAVADFVLREFYQLCRRMGADERLSGGGGGWSGPKGGDIQILAPNQHVLEQSAIRFDSKTNSLIAQLTINLPARGRTILGRAAHEIFANTLLTMVRQGLLYSSMNAKHLQDHADSVEDQVWLQSQLEARNLVAFVPNGAILPRKTGVDDRPLPDGLPFQSPDRLQLSFDLPNARASISGMGIPKGIFLICGGGFHGKSTLLEALQVGVYPKIPGDGREFCLSSPNAFKIRSEDGRNVQSVDISSFINNLPFGKTTTSFTTPDASGSTSQAANIVEAMEMGTDLFLIDEDKCAANALFRDSKMMQLVPSNKEPITPFLHLVRNLYDAQGISSVLVVGGVGDYLDVADTVVAMDSYQCIDVTEQAKQIATSQPASSLSHSSDEVAPIRKRKLMTSMLSPNGKVKVLSQASVSYSETELDLLGLEQLVDKSQTVGISNALQQLSNFKSNDHLATVLANLERQIEANGLDALVPQGQFHGGMARPRMLELAGAINRLRRDKLIQQA